MEESQQLLPWNTPLPEFRLAMDMENYRLDRTTSVWNNRRALGGLVCSIRGKFLLEAPGPDKERKFKGIQLIPDTADNSGAYYYSILKQHLLDNLGKPTLEYDAFPPNQICLWDSGKLAISLKVEGAEPIDLCTLEVWPKPLPEGAWDDLQSTGTVQDNKLTKFS